MGRLVVLLVAVVVVVTAGLEGLFGLALLGAVALLGLWALTVLLGGFFPWAYGDGPHTLGSDEDDLSALARRPVTRLPPARECPDCGAAMSPVETLPGFYCWTCGTAIMLEPDGRSSRLTAR